MSSYKVVFDRGILETETVEASGYLLLSDGWVEFFAYIDAESKLATLPIRVVVGAYKNVLEIEEIHTAGE